MIFRYQGIPLKNRSPLPKITYNSTAKTMVSNMNDVIAQEINDHDNLEQVCYKVYCAAAAICESTGTPLREQITRTELGSAVMPPWRRRLEMKITDMRRDIGKLFTYLKQDNPSVRLRREIKAISSRAKIKSLDPNYILQLKKLMDVLKQKTAALGHRVRRYNERVIRYK